MMMDFMCLPKVPVTPTPKQLQAHWMMGLKFKRNLINSGNRTRIKDMIRLNKEILHSDVKF